MEKKHRIVLTGGPGGGKTTALDLFHRELSETVAVVPEAATLLFSGGFPRSDDPAAVRVTQTAIYQLQVKLEEVTSLLFPNRFLICDRGTLDGAAYWPGPEQEFFKLLNTSFDQEASRYDHVIFFESAATGGFDIRSGNPIRRESIIAAAALDQKVRNVWSKHPNFHFIGNNRSFISKVNSGLDILMDIVGRP